MGPELSKLSFTGHETFPFRYPWLAKGVRGVILDNELFTREDALVTLGVGKNMVRSIRHWCESLGLIERESASKIIMSATDLGQQLFGEGGWDPYIEDPGTPWLLHWLLVRDQEKASAWNLLFTQFRFNQFTRDQLSDWLLSHAKYSNTRVTESSIKRDVNVLLRTYVPSRITRLLPAEEAFDSPLVQLGLILEIEPGSYTFSICPKPSLPDEIFVYTLNDYWCLHGSQARTLQFEKVLYDTGSPGAAFKLNPNGLSDLIDRIPKKYDIQIDETAGMKTIIMGSGMPQNRMIRALKSYYTK